MDHNVQSNEVIELSTHDLEQITGGTRTDNYNADPPTTYEKTLNLLYKAMGVST